MKHFYDIFRGHFRDEKSTIEDIDQHALWEAIVDDLDDKEAPITTKTPSNKWLLLLLAIPCSFLLYYSLTSNQSSTDSISQQMPNKIEINSIQKNKTNPAIANQKIDKHHTNATEINTSTVEQKKLLNKENNKAQSIDKYSTNSNEAYAKKKSIGQFVPINQTNSTAQKPTEPMVENANNLDLNSENTTAQSTNNQQEIDLVNNINTNVKRDSTTDDIVDKSASNEVKKAVQIESNNTSEGVQQPVDENTTRGISATTTDQPVNTETTNIDVIKPSANTTNDAIDKTSQRQEEQVEITMSTEETNNKVDDNLPTIETIETVDQTKLKFTAIIEAGATYVMPYYTSTDQALSDTKNMTENPYYGHSIGLTTTMTYNNTWSIYTGIRNTTNRTQFEIEENKQITESKNKITGILIDRNDNTLIKEYTIDTQLTTSSYYHIRRNNTYNLLSIPVQLGYQQSIHKIDIGLRVGAVVEFLYNQHGATIDSNQEIVIIDNSTPALFTKTNLSITASPFLRYRLTPKWSIYSQYNFSYHKNSILSSNEIQATILSHLWVAGIEYHF